MTLRTRLELQKLPCFWLSKNLKIYDVEGGWGGYPPSLFWEASEAKNCPKITLFFEKSLRRNAVNISVLAFCGLLPWKVWSLNSLVFTVFHACVFTKHCKYQCFWEGGPKTLSNTAFRTCCVAKVSQIAVFLLRLLTVLARFWGLRSSFCGVSCPANTVINSVNSMGWYLRVEFLWGRKIDHFLPHKHWHKQCEYHGVISWGRVFVGQENWPFPAPQKLSYKYPPTTFTHTVSMSLSCARQHRRFCEA